MTDRTACPVVRSDHPHIWELAISRELATLEAVSDALASLGEWGHQDVRETYVIAHTAEAIWARHVPALVARWADAASTATRAGGSVGWLVSAPDCTPDPAELVALTEGEHPWLQPGPNGTGWQLLMTNVNLSTERNN